MIVDYRTGEVLMHIGDVLTEELDAMLEAMMCELINEAYPDEANDTQ